MPVLHYKGKAMTEKTVDFEKSLERLEAIVEEMESGELSLEQMIKHFEEGSKLVTLCSGKLNEVEQKIEKLVKKGGTLTAEPFEPTE
jgi:exodeoxyribonuclease VII small subunit